MRIRASEFAACTHELIAWEHKVFDAIQRGEAVPFDPFYERNAKLTADVVEACIRQHEDNLDYEIQNFPLYHAGHQEVPGYSSEVIDSEANRRYWSTRLRTQRWDLLPYQQKLAIVQGMDRVLNAHRMTDEDIAAEAAEIQRAAELRAAHLAADPHYYDRDDYGYYD